MNKRVIVSLVALMGIPNLVIAMDRGHLAPRRLEDYSFNVSEYVNETISQQVIRSNIANDMSFSLVFNEQEQVEASNTRAAIYFTRQIINLYDDGAIEGFTGEELIRDLPGNVEAMLDNITGLGLRISELEAQIAREKKKKPVNISAPQEVISIVRGSSKNPKNLSVETESVEINKLTEKLKEANDEIQRQKDLNTLQRQEFESKLAESKLQTGANLVQHREPYRQPVQVLKVSANVESPTVDRE